MHKAYPNSRKTLIQCVPSASQNQPVRRPDNTHFEMPELWLPDGWWRQVNLWRFNVCHSNQQKNNLDHVQWTRTCKKDEKDATLFLFSHKSKMDQLQDTLVEIPQKSWNLWKSIFREIPHGSRFSGSLVFTTCGCLFSSVGLQKKLVVTKLTR